MNATGGQGGRNSYAGYTFIEGQGGWVQALMTVSAGETLYITVGGEGQASGNSFGGGGSGGYNNFGGYEGPGGTAGGGGASDIRTSANSLNTRVIVAGGGGGGPDGDGRFRGGSGGMLCNHYIDLTQMICIHD